MVFIYFLLIAGIPGLICLQFYFSKFNNPWLGLILPNLTFCLSLIVTVIDIMDRNTIIGKEDIEILFQFIFINLFTIVFLAVFFTRKKGLKKRNQIEKMNIQDL